ncbi:MAG: ABC transporter ATP-binding protein/permease [Coriobacteriales bacterium]|jgi:ABC-type lipoprotein export system ATPase subunit|nr:ABC transporter ATP-binding protein/permease [Coriobacteriales bacterium]
MLELKNLVKSYTTAGFTQKALDGVSVTLRDNEFVAVLGPSGSGKTTLLNIVGGLDHYDSGDLIIDGISTREYKDRDWDTYRNNRIGFVFQSYNLIPHQSVLANVELALTLSGVPKAERRKRARMALAQVGLQDHISKKPSQLSGGQMQRVAIARALINDPEILLADEPTGALDSKTSVQIMDLLKEIAADRLVVMVTHNPDLADTYANRTIRLSDGRVVGDSNPVAATEVGHEARPPRRAKMSFFTAVALSFSNLMTKKGRTLMMAFAGSIGIIGIAGILALSNGVNNYIKTVEEDTLSVYPLSITSTGFDMTSLLVGSTATSDDSEEGEAEESEASAGFSLFGGINTEEEELAEEEQLIQEFPIMSSMFDTVQSNDLAALKTYLESSESGIDEYVNTIQYEYDVTPQIYLPVTDPETHKVNPDTSFAALGMGSGVSSSSLLSMGMSTDVFAELLNDYDIYSEQYEVLAGDWPHQADEIVLVVTAAHRVSDYLLYPMGLRDYHELNAMVEAFVNEEEVVTSDDRLDFSYEDIMEVSFTLVYNSDYYTHDDTYDVWVDRSDDAEFVKGLVRDGKELRISGIVAARESSQTMMLTPGLYYTSELVEDIVAHSEASDITKYQLENPTLNIFTNKTFIEEADENAASDFDMGSLFSIDEEAMGNAFSMDDSAMSGLDFSGILDPNAVMAAMPPMDMSGALAGIGNDGATPDMQSALQGALSTAIGGLMQGYMIWYPTSGFPLTDLAAHFGDFMQTPEAQAILVEAIANDPAMAAYQIQMAEYQAQMQAAITGYMQQYMQQMLTIMAEQIAVNMQATMANLTANMANAMHIDEEAFAEAFQFNLDEAELTALMLSMMGGQQSSLNGNLTKLGYADYASPYQISLYPFDFEGKQEILNILDAYNKRMEDAGEEEKVITYTDIVGTLMSSVTTIIDMISMVLVAFVAISLVVSSIMIGVITYISVLERKKEIGILRSIGASKGDIGNVFNAETLIVGFVAGAMGIAIVLVLSVPINLIVLQGFDIPNIVLLPPLPAIILIAVSCLLTFVAGLLPSSAASRKDPVEALRSE